MWENDVLTVNLTYVLCRISYLAILHSSWKTHTKLKDAIQTMGILTSISWHCYPLQLFSRFALYQIDTLPMAVSYVIVDRHFDLACFPWMHIWINMHTCHHAGVWKGWVQAPRYIYTRYIYVQYVASVHVHLWRTERGKQWGMRGLHCSILHPCSILHHQVGKV